MSVLSNITTLLNKNKKTTTKSNSYFYALSTALIGVTLGIFAYAIYKVSELDFSGLRFPIF